MPNKKEELEYSKFFLRNSHLKKYKYKAIPNEDEQNSFEHIDVFAKSPQYKNFGIQSKYIDKKYYADLAKRIREAKKTGFSKIHTRTINNVEWTEETIEKCQTKYSVGIKNNLVLLLQGLFGSQINKKYLQDKLKKFKSSEFMGIYLVFLPRGTQKGKTYTIKKISMLEKL